MKRTITLLSVAMTLTMANAEVTLQGVPVHGDLGNAVKKQMNAQVMTSADDFSFDDITFWVGEGENQAALVIQWNDDREAGALVWGYRFDGTACGFDMIKAVAAADSRLYFAGSDSSYGYTIGGIGYDLDGDGNIGLVDGDTQVEVVDGFAEYSNYDGLTAVDADDLWISGWYSGYWSYLVNDDGTFPPTDYSNFGASGRELVNNSVDGWIYSDFSSETVWKTLIPAEAPSVIPTLPEAFIDGFFIQNEDWFGHALGSINWIASDGTVFYNVDNKANGDTEVLGGTSQYGQIYGGLYYVMSKQAPRLVILEPYSMQVVMSYDEIGDGDGRAVLGVDESKVYVGSSAGIFVLDLNEFTISETAIEGTSGQVGMMVRVGKYVFAALQSTGILVIDPVTDTIVQTIENSNICGLTVSRDGTVWGAAKGDILRINPITLESETMTLPNSIVSPWGTWMADKMCADPDEDALYYGYGASWANTEPSIGKLVINEDGSLSEDPTFSFTMPAAAAENRKQILYGKIDIDPISGYLVATTTQNGYGSNYSYNWLHYIDRTTGEVVKTVVLTSDTGENYYWFPAMPIFPDNNMPEVTLTQITLSTEATASYNIVDFVTDLDNMPALAVVEASSSDENIFTVSNDGLTLTVSAVAQGTADLILKVNSNGRVIEVTIPVTIDILNSVINDRLNNVSVYPTAVSDMLYVNGLQSGKVTIYNLTGAQVATHNLANGNAINLSNLPNGAYVVKVTDGNKSQTKKIVKI